MVLGELCGTFLYAIAGLAFNSGGNFPPEYAHALFFADASRRCVWTLFANGSGLPDKTTASSA